MTTRLSADEDPVPSLVRSILTGSVGFTMASLCVFSTVAFAERWMYTYLTPAGSYLVWIAMFILVGGNFLGSLVTGRWRSPNFYLLFAMAFFAYAVGWISAYFLLGGTIGEWIGSLFASILMASVFALGFGIRTAALSFSAVLFVTNSLAYFLGSTLYNFVHGPAGMVLWGIVYGLFLGAGIGAVLYLATATGMCGGSTCIRSIWLTPCPYPRCGQGKRSTPLR